MVGLSVDRSVGLSIKKAEKLQLQRSNPNGVLVCFRRISPVLFEMCDQPNVG